MADSTCVHAVDWFSAGTPDERTTCNLGYEDCAGCQEYEEKEETVR